MTSRTQILIAEQQKSLKSIPRSQVVRIIDGDDELKNIAGQVLTYNSKNFHWLNRKTRPRMDYEWIEKTIFKKSDQKNKKKINAKMPHVNKKTTSEKWKFNSNKKRGLEWAVNGLGKPFRKTPIQKLEKNSKNQSEIAACEPLPRNRIFVQTPFSLYYKIRTKKIYAAKPLAFSLHFLFRRDQNHYSNLTSKIMKMCEQILKKKTAPQYNSNSLNCKKPRCPK